MYDHKKTDLLLTVARMYYECNYNQRTIADKIGISRPYVSKLIQEARSAGIVDIKINDPMESENSLERQIRIKYGLHRVIVIPSLPNENSMQQVGITAGRYLNTIVKDSDIIGVSNGTTVYNCATNLIKRDDIDNIKVVQLTGGLINISHRISTIDNVRLFAEAFNGTPYVMPLPVFFNDSKTKDAVFTDKNIQQIRELQESCNITVFSVGAIGAVGTHSLIQSGYLLEEQMASLAKKGAVGDLFSHFMNKHGDICDEKLDERNVSIPLDSLRQKDYRICLASGRGKLDSLCAALKGNYINVLIIDEELAKGIASRNS